MSTFVNNWRKHKYSSTFYRQVRKNFDKIVNSRKVASVIPVRSSGSDYSYDDKCSSSDDQDSTSKFLQQVSLKIPIKKSVNPKLCM